MTPRNSPFGPRTLPNFVARTIFSLRSRIARPTSFSFSPSAPGEAIPTIFKKPSGSSDLTTDGDPQTEAGYAKRYVRQKTWFEYDKEEPDVYLRGKLLNEGRRRLRRVTYLVRRSDRRGGKVTERRVPPGPVEPYEEGTIDVRMIVSSVSDEIWYDIELERVELDVRANGLPRSRPPTIGVILVARWDE